MKLLEGPLRSAVRILLNLRVAYRYRPASITIDHAIISLLMDVS